MKKIILTGGGTAGHVTPNIALMPSLKEAGYEISYIGSYTGIEKQLIEEKGIPYYGISSGKLRRYKSLKNLSDPFRVIHGYFQARKLMRKIKPDIVFSKGGFVSVPVVLDAGCRNQSSVLMFHLCSRASPFHFIFKIQIKSKSIIFASMIIVSKSLFPFYYNLRAKTRKFY